MIVKTRQRVARKTLVATFKVKGFNRYHIYTMNHYLTICLTHLHPSTSRDVSRQSSHVKWPFLQHTFNCKFIDLTKKYHEMINN